MSSLAGLYASGTTLGKSALNKLQFNRANNRLTKASPNPCLPGSAKMPAIRNRRKMTAEQILTKHPLGKSGRNIDRDKYETLKKAILSALRSNELTHTELFSRL